jgi:hypothetical protein
VVIGDFNDRNVLVKGADGYLIDADSFQFERFLCGVFTDRFVDPLLCKAVAGGLAQAKPHSADSDWYAYAVLLMQSLLFVGPYGGIYRPKDSARRLVQSVRPLHRITVFNPEVQYPKPASSLSTLPEDLLEVFHRIFEKDERAAFPMARLQSLQFTRCASCSTEHARIACPVCSPSAALRTKIALRVRGQVTCKPLFETSGLILEATTDRDELGVVLHESDAFRREDGTVLFRGPLDRRLRFAISGKDTLVGKAGEMVVLSPNQPPAKQQVDSDGRFGAFTASASRRFWIQDGRLMRFTPLSGVFGAPEQVGEVLANQTRFWVGRTFGLGLYRAGALSVGFVFDLDKLGINDQLKLPRLPGELLEADCTLSESRAWLRLALQTGGQTRHLCLAWSRTGQLEGLAEASAGDGTWLGAMGGAVAVGGMLLVATDAGIARVELKNGAMEKTTDFPDTEPFVSSDCRLLVSKDGLLVVGAHQINALHLP